ncbi:MAG: class I SAM-dependent methyltransferase [Eubacteriales bacterium]|nr:class I SAM-dependent methyltransferase [Eubacteriales bacterium]
MYGKFAYVYDKLMSDINYSDWADYIVRIFEKFDLKPELIADLGCGTGSLCIEMAKQGYDMIGIDSSPDMLNCATVKAKKITADIQMHAGKNIQKQTGNDILWLNQDMTDFELYGTVDAIVCLMDSINHITRQTQLERMFKLVKNYLNPGGLFIFDVNSPYKLEKILGNNVFYSVEDEVAYIWQNSYNAKSAVCRFDLTFFVKKPDEGFFERFDEIHHEKAYTFEFLESMLKASGLEFLNSFNDLSFRKPGPKSERIFYISRKGM